MKIKHLTDEETAELDSIEQKMNAQEEKVKAMLQKPSANWTADEAKTMWSYNETMQALLAQRAKLIG